MKETDVIIVNYRRPELCRRTAELVSRESCVRTIVIINNCSVGKVNQDDLGSVLTDVKLIELGSNRGFAHAANLGLTDSLGRGAEKILLLNPDVFFSPGAMTRLGEAIERAEELVIAIPFEPRLRGASAFPERSRPNRGIVLTAAYAWMVPNSVLRSVGLFDEQFFFGREDTDFCIRFSMAGGRFAFVTGLGIKHALEGGSPDDTISESIRAYHMMRGALILLKKYGPNEVGLINWLRLVWELPRNFLATFLTKASFSLSLWQLRALVPGSVWPKADPA